MQTKQIIEILSKYFDTPKKSGQNLTDQELTVVFEHLTQTNQVSSIESIYADTALAEKAELADGGHDAVLHEALDHLGPGLLHPAGQFEQLTEYELVAEEWGGQTIICPISAKTGMGIENLLEMVSLTAEVAELKANPNRAAQGTVIEARLDKGRGPVATLLVQNGTLKQGDIIIAGTAVGRVRAMVDDKGSRLTQAGPSVPVEITGLADVPGAGSVFNAVADERLARELAEQRRS